MGAGKMNRKQRKELGRKLQSANPGLEVVHPRAAGIDVWAMARITWCSTPGTRCRASRLTVGS